jgi:hypothetical protein
MRLFHNALVTILLLTSISSLCWAAEPFIMGEGRYLQAKEQEAFLQHLRQTGSESEKQKFAQAFQHLQDTAWKKPASIAVLEFTRFNVDTVFSDKLRTGYQTFMVCFNCSENIPPEKRAARSKLKSKYYDIWVLSANFIVVEQSPKSGEWRVLLDDGAAE